ncbi:Uncharacterised protein [Vibrio cholerae]|nr:Uncharacterised protein [Vibrio cholerae]
MAIASPPIIRAMKFNPWPWSVSIKMTLPSLALSVL